MAFSGEGDGGLSKLNIGGGKLTSRGKKADGRPSTWDTKGTLTNQPKKRSAYS